MKASGVALVEGETSAEEAFARRLPEFLALSPKEVLHINLDLPSAIATALGVLPKVRALREALESAVRKYNFALVDGLEDYALALNHAHASYLATTRPIRCSRESLAEARLLRRKLLQDLKAFATRGLVEAEKWKQLRGAVGYVNLATDLSLLSHIYRSSAQLLPSNPVASKAEIERATELAKQMLTAAGRRRPKAETAAVAADLRARVFTVFVRSYDETRHGIAFLRREEGDVDSIVPSLFSVHRARAHTKKAATPQNESGSPGVVSVTKEGVPSAPSMSAMTSPFEDEAIEPAPAQRASGKTALN
jgi:hypothetical protein